MNTVLTFIISLYEVGEVETGQASSGLCASGWVSGGLLGLASGCVMGGANGLWGGGLPGGAGARRVYQYHIRNISKDFFLSLDSATECDELYTTVYPGRAHSGV